MGVAWARFLAAIQEHKQIEVHPRGKGFHLRHNLKRADLRRLEGPTDEYQIREIRYIASRLKLDRDIIRNHIPEL